MHVRDALSEWFDKGVVRFDALGNEGEEKPCEEFWRRMMEIIFDGKCDITSYWRSSVDLGLNIGLREGAGIRAAVHRMTMYLLHATKHAIADAFGDEEFAKAQSEAMKRLADGSTDR